MRASPLQPESPTWGTHHGTNSLLDSNHDGMRALLIVLFYGCLFILYGVVSLFRTVSSAVGFPPRPSPKELGSATQNWQRGL